MFEADISSDHRRILFTNLMLLGLEVPVVKGKCMNISQDMFMVPNKAGFEYVAHFLFEKLNPERCKEEFKICWPVTNKKDEQTFRRVCNGWLAQISEDPSSHLPRIVPSLFQSPGGEKFTHLMYSFSNYVLLQVAKRQHGLKNSDFLLRPFLTPDSLEFAEPMYQAAQCAAISERKKFFNQVQLREKLQKRWSSSARSMAAEYRRLSKAIRDKEAAIQSLLQSHQDKGIKAPVRTDTSYRKSFGSSKHGQVFDVNIESVKRNEKVAKVRQLWKMTEDFLVENREKQDIVGSIVAGVTEKLCLSANDLDLRVPEMLLRECEREILKQDINSTYTAGTLDLLSVLQLWNLCLHLYLEKFEECEVADFRSSLDALQLKYQCQQSQLNACNDLRHQLHDGFIPELRSSITALESKYFSTHGVTSASRLGMSLMPETPPLHFSAERAQPKHVDASKMSQTPTLNSGSTPETVQRIMKSIMASSTKRADRVDPELTSQTTQNVMANALLSPLAQGTPTKSRAGFADGNRESPARADGSVEVRRIGNKQVTQLKEPGVNSPLSNQALSHQGYTRPEEPRTRNDRFDLAADVQLTPLTGKRPTVSPFAMGKSPTKRQALLNLSAQIEEQKAKIQDLLAEQIAGEIEMRNALGSEDGGVISEPPSPEAELFNVINQLDEEAFKKKDHLTRTPEFSEGPPVERPLGTPFTLNKHIWATPNQNVFKDESGEEDEDKENVEFGDGIITVEADDSLADVDRYLLSDTSCSLHQSKRTLDLLKDKTAGFTLMDEQLLEFADTP